MTVSPVALQADQKSAQESAQTEPKAEPAKQEPDIARQFAALTKKERMIYREREALKAERAAVEAEKAEAAELKRKYGARPANPREALDRYGFDYKTATEFELNNGEPTAEFIARQAQDEVKQLRKERDDRDKETAENATKQAEAEKAQLVQEFKDEIKSYAQEKADDCELINFYDAHEVIYHYIEKHYRETGKLLSVPEGANIVEQHLEQQLEKVQATKKFAKHRKGEPPTPESGFKQQPEPSAQRRTLDNSLTQSSPTLIKSARVEDDRMKRALAALNK